MKQKMDRKIKNWKKLTKNLEKPRTGKQIMKENRMKFYSLKKNSQMTFLMESERCSDT